MDKAVAKTTGGDTDKKMILAVVGTGLVCLAIGTFLLGPPVEKWKARKKEEKSKKGKANSQEPGKKV